MSIPYFYEPSILSGQTSFTLNEISSKHCVQVLRMQENQRVDITNGLGYLFEAVIVNAHKKNTLVQIQSEKFITASSQKITLGIGLLKNLTRLEWLLEKATEMGVYEIMPLVCEHTLFEKFKLDRFQNILQSAMIQSQQVWLPLLGTPLKFKEAIQNQKQVQKLIAHCEAGDKINIKEIKASADLLLFIGPEGDFSTAEIELALANNYQAIHLGPTRLRTETAALFALSVLKKF
jgi:16S rRNA (uracil1498-N3)-methyltransferase